MTATPTAAERAAAEAWALVMRDEDAMPPWAARDYVMDHTGDREAAVSLLRHAAADWLRERRPDQLDGIYLMAKLHTGEVTAAKMEAEAIREWYATDVQGRFFPRQRDERWLAWCDDADRALAACRAMTQGV